MEMDEEAGCAEHKSRRFAVHLVGELLLSPLAQKNEKDEQCQYRD